MSQPNPDEQQSIELNLSGDDPVTNAKTMLQGIDLDDDEVSRIHLQVFTERETTPTPPASSSSDSSPSQDAPRGRLTEDDRDLGAIQPNTSHHLVLAELAALSADHDDDLFSAEIVADRFPGPADRNHVSTVLSKLYRRRLADREAGSRPYRYRITTHGRAELDTHGADVTPDDVGGVWSDDDG